GRAARRGRRGAPVSGGGIHGEAEPGGRAARVRAGRSLEHAHPRRRRPGAGGARMAGGAARQRASGGDPMEWHGGARRRRRRGRVRTHPATRLLPRSPGAAAPATDPVAPAAPRPPARLGDPRAGGPGPPRRRVGARLDARARPGPTRGRAADAGLAPRTWRRYLTAWGGRTMCIERRSERRWMSGRARLWTSLPGLAL